MTTPAPRIRTLLALVLGLSLLGACGGSDGDGQEGMGDAQLAGPFVIDFESPAADITPEAEPFTAGPNVTMSSASNLFIWSNAQGWGVTEAGCNAAFLGNQGIGSDDDTDAHTLFIEFTDAVATVEMVVAAAVGTPIEIQSVDAAGGVVETITVTAPPCPGPMTLVRLGLNATSNGIQRVRIRGDVPVIDNLTWYRFQ